MALKCARATVTNVETYGVALPITLFDLNVTKSPRYMHHAFKMLTRLRLHLVLDNVKAHIMYLQDGLANFLASSHAKLG